MSQPLPKADLNNPNEIIRILKNSVWMQKVRHDKYHKITGLTWCKRCERFEGNEGTELGTTRVGIVKTSEVER